MKSIFLSLALVTCILIAGCSPVAPTITPTLNSPKATSTIHLNVPFTTTPTPTPSPTEKSTGTITQTPRPTLTYQPSQTPTATSTIPLPPFSMSRTILTVDELIAETPYFKNFFDTTIDATDDLITNDNCLLDCAKHTWPRRSMYGGNFITIILLKSSTAERAQRQVETTHSRFTNIEDLSERINYIQLPQNAWSAWSYDEHQFVFVFSYGPISMTIINRPFDGFHDFAGEFDLTHHLARLQYEKIQSSGYIGN
jgi:hypothetical protein